MKKLLLSLMLLPLAAWSETRIATVDMMMLVRNHLNYESNKNVLQSTEKDNQKKLDVIKGEGEKLQEEGKKLAEQLRNPMLVAKAKSDIEEQLMALQQKLVGIEQRYRTESMRLRQELQEMEARMLKATTEDLRKRIKKVAEAEKYDLVLDKSAAPFAIDSLDVTDQVFKDMGVDPKAVRDKADEGK